MSDLASGQVAATPESGVATFITFTRKLVAKNYFAASVFAIVASGIIVALKWIQITQLQGDSALFFQVTENIAHRGTAMSGMFANIIYFMKSGLFTLPAAGYATVPLTPPASPEANLLSWHAYYILYPIAVLAKFIPTEPLLLSLYALSFTGLVAFAYVALRGKGVAIAAALLFCLLIVSHPGWSQALLFGQFYPDRLFVFLGFAFMYVASRHQSKRTAIVLLSIPCALVDERTAMMAGVFLLAYVGLFWKSVSDRYFKVSLAVALLCFGFLVMKFGISNYYYSSFLPGSLGQAIANFHDPVFAAKTGTLLLVNATFLIIALFEWRAAAIAFLLMLPNIFGTIGGAEKIGWITHYHSYYLPALVWAAMLGFEKAYTWARSRRAIPAFYAASAVAVLFISMINPYAYGPVNIAFSNIGNNFVFKLYHQMSSYFTRAGLALHGLGAQISQAVPEGSVVTTEEGSMPFLYHNRTVHFFPIGLDTADYAVLSVTKNAKSQPVYIGAVTALGPKQQEAINAVIHQRMIKDHYDFSHPTVIGPLSIAIVKRLH